MPFKIEFEFVGFAYVNDELIERLQKHRFDLDAEDKALNAEVVKMPCAGIRVNCWTVDGSDTAARLIDFGVDYITTNILE